MQQPIRISAWLAGAAVALAGMLVSAWLYQQQQASLAAIGHARLQHRSSEFADALGQRIAAYTEIAYGLRGLFVANPALGRADFERVVTELDVLARYPGAKNLAFSRYVSAAQRPAFEARVRADTSLNPAGYPGFAIHPPGARAEYFVADYLWPRAGNEQIMGLDISTQSANLAAMHYSRATGKAVASAPFELMQEKDHPLGFVIRVPVYGPQAGASAPDAPAPFLGAVAVTTRIHDLVQAIASEGHMQGLAVAMSDLGTLHTGTPQQPAKPLFQSEGLSARGSPALLREVVVHDRRWQLAFYPTGDFVTAAEARLPRVAAITGALAALLLGMVVALLARQRAAALARMSVSDSARAESEGRFHALFHQAAVGVALAQTATGRLIDVNQKFCAILGYAANELPRMDGLRIADAQIAAEDAAQMAQFRDTGGGEFKLEMPCLHADGRVIWVERTISAMHMDGGHQGYHAIVLQDITQRRQMQDELLDSKVRLSSILRRMPVGVCLVRPDESMAFFNQRFAEILGYTEETYPPPETWWQNAYPDPEYRRRIQAFWHTAHQKAMADGSPIEPAEYTICCKDGQERTVDIAGVMVGEDLLVTIVDLTQHKAAAEEIRTLAFFDVLTHLPNRRLLVDRLQQALAASARHQRCGALVVLDLDNFKALNDTRGHEKGDALLLQVAARLRACVHADDTVARPGGDEFALVLEDLGDTPQEAAACCEDMGQKILAALREPYVIEGEAHHSTMSLGITVFCGGSDTVEVLLQRGDLAMYQAKAAGRDTLRFYDPQMQAVATARAALEEDMRAGLEQNQFELFYQPQMDHGRITGAEALVRWHHPRQGFVSPASFIPMAEESGLILPLGQWVLHQACTCLAQWALDPVLAELTLAVNVSPRQFRQPGFVQQVLTTLASTGAPARRLKLELTEGLLLQDIDDSAARMSELRSYGVGFSLDDFGTGYSSLAYLKRLPLDQLKIDQSFVRDVLTDPNDASIVRTILALGASLGLHVIAEGVETAPQRDFLERHHCHAWQGYLMSRPVMVDAFVHIVREHAPQ